MGENCSRKLGIISCVEGTCRNVGQPFFQECQNHDHESGSETGLNIPIHDDDMLQISHHGRSHSLKHNNGNKNNNLSSEVLKAGRLQGETNAALDFDDEVVSTTGASQVITVHMLIPLVMCGLIDLGSEIFKNYL